MFLAVLGIVSNSSAESIDVIQGQMFIMNCPLPIYNGVATLDPIAPFNGFALNYTVTSNPDITTDFNGTKFECTYDPLSAPPHLGANTVIYNYGATTFFGTIPYGWLGYLSDTLGNIFGRLQAMFTLISFFVAPTNFNILGYSLTDLGGFALMFVIAIYAFCYIAIGAFLYKTLSPFSGVG